MKGRPASAIDVRSLSPEERAELARALAPELVPLVLASIAARLGVVAELAPFSTRQGGEVPLEFQGRRKAWLSLAPTIPGAVKLGRWWSVSRATYADWLAAGAKPVSRESGASPPPAEPWSPARAFAELEGRAAAGGRR